MLEGVEFTCKLPVKIKKEIKCFLASCPVLDVHSQGETEEKAKKNLVEALSLFLISCFERHTLEAVLQESGFRPAIKYKIPLAKQKENPNDYIDIPLPFKINHQKSLTEKCHA